MPETLPDAPFTFAGVDNSKGLAFVITPESPWFERLQSESDSLLRPYITGDDITSSALNRIGRWALDIGDRSLDEIARRWPIAYRFIVEEVQPTRTVAALKSYKGLINRWWQFWNHRSDLMRRIRQKPEFIAYSKVTKHPICMLADSAWIYTNQVLLVSTEREDMFSVCLSSFFRTWLERFCGGGLGVTLRLSISESVAKYPVPSNEVSQAGVDAAKRFNDLATAFSAAHECGLTDVMNAIHTPGEEDATIVELRQLLVVIDNEVTAAYGWDDIEIVYDFREIDGGAANDPWRWSLSEGITADVLGRLTALNRERFDADVSSRGASTATKSKRGPSPKAAASMSLNDLFAGDHS